MRDPVHCPKCGSKKTKRLRFIYECRICHEKWPNSTKRVMNRIKDTYPFFDYYFERIKEISKAIK